MRSILLLVVVLASGCELFFDDGGKRPPQCDDLVPTGSGEAEIAPAPLRNPEQLTCESFGGGTCDPDCGPCPAEDLAALQPIPSWPQCGSTCETLGESECAANAECRVVKDARCMIGEDCITDFMGCFPIDLVPQPVDCFKAFDGWECSRSSSCTALHDRGTGCTGDQCARSFALCVPEGSSPGNCHDPVTCRALPPACPSGKTPGIANGCFTGACIPLGLCENSV